MGLFESCVNTFESMDPLLKKDCLSLWKSISLATQEKKLTSNGILNADKREAILESLSQRPAFLIYVALKAINLGYKMETIAEVGTAQGLQSIIFASVLKNSRIFTCDIKDDRDSNFSNYKNLNFILGNSMSLKKELVKEQRKVDLFWIDGSHENYAVIDDFLSLQSCSHRDTIWAFDDYDSRFGCFMDLNVLIRHFEEAIVLDLGLTASGNPNRIILARRLK